MKAPSEPIMVAVPARDEARRLPALLAALARQREAPRFTLALLLDGCADESEAVVAALAPAQPYAILMHRRDEQDAPNAGLVRAHACDHAIAHMGDGVLLTTDADSAPAPDWIAANLTALGRADIVAGRIMRRPGSSPMQDRLEDYYDRLHHLRRAIDPVVWEDAATHHWTSGASLALRVATYRQLGGFPPLARGEDAALADQASRLGLRVRRDARVIVHTSARRRGRVAGGFATALAMLDRPGATPMVAHPEDEAWRYRRQALARAKAGSDENGEALAAQAGGAPPGGMRRVPLALAEAALAALALPLEGAA